MLDALHRAQTKRPEIGAEHDLRASSKRTPGQVGARPPGRFRRLYSPPKEKKIVFFIFCVFDDYNFSYKLWYNYLRERRKQIKGKCVTDPAYEEVNNCHERALVFMHKVKVQAAAGKSSEVHVLLVKASVIKNEVNTFRPGFLTDAEDMAGLLSVHRVSVQNHEKPSDVRPGAPSSARHPAPPHLAPVPQIRPQVTPTRDRHPGLSQISEGWCRIAYNLYIHTGWIKFIHGYNSL